MTRGRLAVLATVLLLLAGALVLGSRGGGASTRQAVGPDLAPLRAAAALAPCPAGVSPALPDLLLPCLGGGPPVRLSAAAPGRPTVVNLWAVWCEPCQRETPLLVDLHRRAGDRLGMLGVVTESETDLSLHFSQDFGIRYPSVEDDAGVLFRRYAGGLPVTLFVDARGRVAGTKTGGIASRAELDGLVRTHLGVRP